MDLRGINFAINFFQFQEEMYPASSPVNVNSYLNLKSSLCPGVKHLSSSFKWNHFNYKINSIEQESDEVDPRLSSIRDTSFSWESLDSQVGSRQSLLDNKGRSSLLNVSQSKLGAIQVSVLLHNMSSHSWGNLPGSCKDGLSLSVGSVMRTIPWIQGSWPVASQPAWLGNAGGEDQEMDLTRRQREQRKKDIREKVRSCLVWLSVLCHHLYSIDKTNLER